MRKQVKTVFISGSLSITELNSFDQAHIRSCITSDMNILIGDAYGVDSLVQKELADYGYSRVAIYASNGVVRNNIGKWNVKAIDVPTGIYGRAFYEQKDIAMSHDCDFGLMLWDGKSKGTLNNIRRMIEFGKISIVCLHTTHKSYKITNEQQLDAMLNDLK